MSFKAENQYLIRLNEFIHSNTITECLLWVRHCLDVGNTTMNKSDKDPLIALIFVVYPRGF